MENFMETNGNDIKVKKTPAYEQVYSYMLTAIHEKKWDVGQKIPPETELAETFGVNRLTVRMALQKLSALGLLESRVGDGTYVKEFSFQDYVSKVTDFYMNPELLHQVCTFRKAVETECSRLAILYATPEELSELGTICEEYDELKKKVSDSWEESYFSELAKKDLEFHYKICLLSHNQLFIYAFDVAKEAIYQYLLVLLNKRIEGWIKRYSSFSEVNDLHRVIYRAIMEKDFEACKKAYLDMVDFEVDL